MNAWSFILVKVTGHKMALQQKYQRQRSVKKLRITVVGQKDIQKPLQRNNQYSLVSDYTGSKGESSITQGFKSRNEILKETKKFKERAWSSTKTMDWF